MGDKKNAIKKLQLCVKSIKYNSTLDLKEINIGSPKEYLKLYHYLFMDYSVLIANEILNKHQLELNTKNDKQFMDGVYKLLRDMFEYVPKLNQSQFFATNFAQVKASMAADIIQLIQNKLKSLQPSTNLVLSNLQNGGLSLPITTAAQTTTTGGGAPMSCVASSASNGFVIPSFGGRGLSNGTVMSTAASSVSTTSKISTKPFKNGQLLAHTQIDSNDEISPRRNNKQQFSKPSIQNHLIATNSQRQIGHKISNQNNHIADFGLDSNGHLGESVLSRIEQMNRQLEEVTAKYDSILSHINDGKYELFDQRLSQIEQHVGMSNKNEPSNNTNTNNNKSNDDFIKISKKDYENITSRLTVLETVFLMNKKGNRLSIPVQETNQEDMTTYETPFHSFLNTTDQNDMSNSTILHGCYNTNGNELIINGCNSNKTNGIICQGVAVDFDKLRFHDQSVNSNDSTPTQLKQSRYVNEHLNDVSFDESNVKIDSDEMTRAKKLVLKASMLNEVTSKIKS